MRRPGSVNSGTIGSTQSWQDIFVVIHPVECRFYIRFNSNKTAFFVKQNTRRRANRYRSFGSLTFNYFGLTEIKDDLSIEGRNLERKEQE